MQLKNRSCSLKSSLVLINKKKIISMDTIFQNREFPFLHIFHYTSPRNELRLMLKWNLVGLLDINAFFFLVLYGEHIDVEYVLGYESPLVKEWSVMNNFTKKCCIFHVFKNDHEISMSLNKYVTKMVDCIIFVSIFYLQFFY